MCTCKGGEVVLRQESAPQQRSFLISCHVDGRYGDAIPPAVDTKKGVVRDLDDLARQSLLNDRVALPQVEVTSTARVLADS